MPHPPDIDAPPCRDWRIAARDGTRLAAVDQGPRDAAGHAVLCLPGLTRSSEDFADLARHLARDRRVVRLDARGRGASARPRAASAYGPSVDIDDTIQATIALGLDRFVAVGTSYGGLQAMVLALVRPAAVAGVVLNDIGPDIAGDGVDRIFDFIAVDRPEPDWSSAEATLRRALPDLGLPDDEAWRRFTEATYTRGADGRLHFAWDVRLAAAYRPRPGQPDPWRLFRGLGRIPTLLVRGARSDVLRPETVARMRTVKPDLETVEAPGVGHAPSLVEPAVAGAIDRFLARLDGSGAKPLAGSGAPVR